MIYTLFQMRLMLSLTLGFKPRLGPRNRFPEGMNLTNLDIVISDLS